MTTSRTWRLFCSPCLRNANIFPKRSLLVITNFQINWNTLTRKPLCFNIRSFILSCMVWEFCSYNMNSPFTFRCSFYTIFAGGKFLSTRINIRLTISRKKFFHTAEKILQQSQNENEHIAVVKKKLVQGRAHFSSSLFNPQ